MDVSAEQRLVEQVLDDVERRESTRLVWGLVDGYLTHDELFALISPLLDRAMADHLNLSFLSEEQVIAALLTDGLLHQVLGAVAYRSRMAEGIRLISKLRQLFPKHDAGSKWLTAPTLVADFRFLWRRRRYPARNIPPSLALETIRAEFADIAGLTEMIGGRLRSMDKDYRLSAFQINATMRILDGLSRRITQGTLVSAGTGSGKTLAFYLPALSWTARNLAQGDKSRVQVMALYPRNELLKDQFSEVFKQARSYDGLLSSANSRPIRMAALYGDVPSRAADVEEKVDGKPRWEQVSGGHRCPFLRCAVAACDGAMVWLEADRRVERERLVCAACGNATSEDELMLTRARMLRESPDVLFVTSEMINQRLSDSNYRRLFGLVAPSPKPPDIVLLDEVHLYGSTFGAHIAYLIRRWRAHAKSNTSFVGLSATLRDGAQFFATLVGLAEDQVREVAPLEVDLIPEGAEYGLVLRGDPVSRRALLSTTIQTIMLSARLLDPRSKALARRLFGWRSFVFSDQLDSVTRLFKKSRDAEGRWPDSGRPNMQFAPNGGLARLRSNRGNAARYAGGQDWDFIESVIGHGLSNRLSIARTTSSDRGVDPDSEVIVATAALEVGYDDPAVGIVIQHKAPRDIAAFLQRKGRAGRTRGMRPWTIVVLSDYGRDRICYQAYDQLFDPELPPRNLPIRNRYVQRIQATYVLLEYLSQKLPQGSPAGSVWMDLTAPRPNSVPADEEALEAIWASNAGQLPLRPAERQALHVLAARGQPNTRQIVNWMYAREKRELLARLLRDIGEDPLKLEDLGSAIRLATGLSEEDLRAVLWDYPRPIALSVLPTTYRRLATGWRSAAGRGKDVFGSGPLPDFVPSKLFDDLHLPEVEIVLPGATGGGSRATTRHYLPVLQALGEFAPGKVSWRYDEPLWIAPPALDPAASSIDLDVSQFYEFDDCQPFPIRDGDELSYIEALRPRVAKLQTLPTNVIQDTSNARLDWRTKIVARTKGVEASPPRHMPTASLVKKLHYHGHSEHAPVLVRRFAVGSDASIRRPGASASQDVRFVFAKASRRCGIGFEFEADGIAFEISLPPSLSSEISKYPKANRGLRSLRFADEVRNGSAVSTVVANPFQREWLGAVFLAAVTLEAISGGCTLERAADSVAVGKSRILAVDVLDTIFQSPVEDDSDHHDGDHAPEDRLRQDLVRSLNDPIVLAHLRSAATRLWEPIDDNWEEWLRQVAMTTIGGAILTACAALCPDIDSDDLVVDVDSGVREHDGLSESLENQSDIWLTESVPGGNGLLEAIFAQYLADPGRWCALVEAALGPNDYETTNIQLTRLIDSICSSSPEESVRGDVYAVRAARTSRDLDGAFGLLRRNLSANGYSVFHGFISSLSNRLLRPNSPRGIDEFLKNVIEQWNAAEESTGIEVDNRLIAFLSSADDSIDQLLVRAGFELPLSNRRPWRYNAIYSLLWPRGAVIREASVRFYNPYAGAGITERLLVACLLPSAQAPVDGGRAGWLDTFIARLETEGTATVSLRSDDNKSWMALCSRCVLEPVALDYLNMYPTLKRISRVDANVLISFEIGLTK